MGVEIDVTPPETVSALVVRERGLSPARIRVVAVEIPFVNCPPTKRRDVVGARRPFRGPATDEEARIPPECPLIVTVV